MLREPHIVIIGAGLIGLSTADSLRARGAQVTVIDTKKGPGQGASFCNSGMIHPSQAAPWLDGDFAKETQDVLSLAKDSRRLLQSRMKTLGLWSPKQAPGCVQLYDTKFAGEQAQIRYESIGVACKNISGAAHTFDRYALSFPLDYAGNAYDYCTALERDLKTRGVQFEYGAANVPACDHVVIAAGANSADAARPYGFELPITPVTGHALNFERPDADLPEVPIMHQASRSALTVFADHVRLSGTTDEAGPDSLLDIWRGIAPDILAALGQPTFSWSGERPVCRLGRPIIGGARPGVWVNSGHAHMGWTLSAGSGELLASMMMDGHEDTRFSYPS